MRQQKSYIHHGRVVGKKESGAFLLFEFIYELRVIRYELHAALIGACSLKTVVQILSLVPADIELLQIGIRAKFLVIGVLDPGYVVAVSGAVVETQDSVEVVLETGHISESLIAARGVLDEDHLQDIVTEVEGLHAPEGGTDIGERLNGLRDGKPQRFVSCDTRGGVIDVIDSGKRDIDLLCVLIHLNVECAPVCVRAVDRCHRDVRSAAPVTAFRAIEAAKVCVNVVVIFVTAAAFGALAGIGEVYVALLADAAFQAITDHLIGVSEREGRRLCVVRVEDKDRSGTELYAFTDLRQCVLNTAEAVRLIA